MQATDKSKQMVKPLEQHYRPLGMKAVLSATLMLKAGKKTPKLA